MSFEDIARKMQEEANKKPRMEIVDQTLDLGMTLTAKDFIEPIKKIKKLQIGSTNSVELLSCNQHNQVARRLRSIKFIFKLMSSFTEITDL